MVGRRPSGLATFFCEGPLEAGRVADLGDGEAHHVRVRRLEAGTHVRLVDGVGTVGAGILARITKAGASVEVEEASHVTRPAAIHLLAPIGDRDRMLWLGEKATELGLTSWRGVLWQRSRGVSPRGEGEAFHAKLRTRMISALTQSGGAWLPEILPDARLEDIIETSAPGAWFLLDGAGDPILGSSVTAPLTIAVGPEGGLEDGEREKMVAAGWLPVSLGATTLRFETAGMAALAIARAAFAANVESARG